MNRRNFIKGLLAIGPIAAVAKHLPSAQAEPTLPRYGPIQLNTTTTWGTPGILTVRLMSAPSAEELQAGDLVYLDEQGRARRTLPP